MKNKFSLFVLIATLLMVSCHKDGSTSSSFPANLHEMPLSGAKVGYDGMVYNHEEYGKVAYQHIKYYSTSIDPYSYLPAEIRDDFKKRFEAAQERVKGWSYDQIVDDLVQQNTYTAQQAVILKKDCKDLQAFLRSDHPKQSEVWDWCLAREQQVMDNRQLSKDEKEQILVQKSTIRYALKWHIEQDELNQISNDLRNNVVSLRDDCSTASKVACWVGAISGLSGVGTGVGGLFGLISKAVDVGTSIARASVIGAVIGIVVGAIYAAITCNCVDKAVCSAPVAISFPYVCYTQGDPLRCDIVGSNLPSSFTFKFFYNDDLNNNLWSNFTTNNFIWIPASVMSQKHPDDIAVRVEANCSGNLLVSDNFGWFTLSDLGKPFFTITGNSNLSVDDAAYGQYYQLFGIIAATNASVSWEIIPSGYPGYSATGSFAGGNTHPSMTYIHWDNHPGFASVKCTATTSCSTIVNYFSVHIY